MYKRGVYNIMWKFYYDEAFHDRKITAKDDSINIYKKDSSDIYVGFFCGYKDTKESAVWEKYASFEGKYKKIYTISDDKELKGTTIKKKNYKNGFSSFADNTICFYNDFFEIFDDSEIVFHISMFSKTELLVKEFMKNIRFNNKFVYHRDAFIYSLIKFLYSYRNQELLKNMMHIKTEKDANQVLNYLKDMIKNVIGESGQSKKKEKERKALNDVLSILNNSFVYEFKQPQLSWRYKPIFTGFNNLLYERNINQLDVDLLIDKENNTFQAAIANGNYKRCNEGESHECIGLRISDILAHFFGELVLALEYELKEIEIKSEEDLKKLDYSTKRLLSPKWFKVSQEQFLLWRNIEMIFYKYQLYEWTGYDGVFCDSPNLVFALLEYIFQYNTYEEFMDVKAELHSEYFNTYSCNKLANIYKRGGSR